MSSNQPAYIHLLETPQTEDDLAVAKLFSITGWVASNTALESIVITVENQRVVADLSSRQDVQKVHGEEFEYTLGFSASLDTYVLRDISSLVISISIIGQHSTVIGKEKHTLAVSREKSDTPHYSRSRCHTFIEPLPPLEALQNIKTFPVQGWIASEVEIGQITVQVGSHVLAPKVQPDNVTNDAHKAHINLPEKRTHMVRFSEEFVPACLVDSATPQIELVVYDVNERVIGRDRQFLRNTQRPPVLTNSAPLSRSSRHDFLLVFHHIEKTAGTTIRHILSRQYQPGELYYVYNAERKYRGLEDFKLLSDDQLNQLNIILGHNVRNIRSRIARPSSIVTFLRDPVARLQSLYSFVCRHPNTLLHRVVKDHQLSFVEFVTNIHDLSGIKYIWTDNNFVRNISGITAEFGECSEEMLDVAKENILHDYSVVGLVERFDESLIIMRRMFGWRTPFYVKTNVSGNHPKQTSLTQSEYAAIEPFIKFDMECYNLASEILEKKILAAGQSFAQELDEFTRVNSLTQQWL